MRTPDRLYAVEHGEPSMYYHIAEDPFELDNRCAKLDDEGRRLQDLVEAWERETRWLNGPPE